MAVTFTHLVAMSRWPIKVYPSTIQLLATDICINIDLLTLQSRLHISILTHALSSIHQRRCTSLNSTRSPLTFETRTTDGYTGCSDARGRG